MRYKLRPEAYSHILKFLYKVRGEYASHKSVIKKTILKIKRALLDHELDQKKVVESVTLLLSILQGSDLQEFKQIAHDVKTSKYTKSRHDMWLNPYGRRLESEISINLLLNPTQKMKEAVRKVSQSILRVIKENEDYLKHHPEDDETSKMIRQSFASLQKVDWVDKLGIGRYHEKYSMESFKKILMDNDFKYLDEIMLAHLKFAGIVLRKIPIVTSEKNEKISIESRVKQIDGDFYQSEMYKVCPGRGRNGGLKRWDMYHTTHLGIDVNPLDKKEMPKLKCKPWHADSMAQDAYLAPSDKEYPIVRDMIENDTPFITGFSGLTSLLMPQMRILSDKMTDDEQRAYLCSVIAFIVSAGFHSIHEILGPCAKIIDLIPGYNAAVPSATQKGPVPNYSQFFDLIKKYDPEIEDRLEKSWQRFIQYSPKPFLKVRPNRGLEFANKCLRMAKKVLLFVLLFPAHIFKLGAKLGEVIADKIPELFSTKVASSVIDSRINARDLLPRVVNESGLVVNNRPHDSKYSSESMSPVVSCLKLGK